MLGEEGATASSYECFSVSPVLLNMVFVMNSSGSLLYLSRAEIEKTSIARDTQT